jgi:hypothetical protein
MTRNHGVPYHHIHRRDYQVMLHHLARTATGVRICHRLGALVRDFQPDLAVAGGPTVMLACGDVVFPLCSSPSLPPRYHESQGISIECVGF